MAPGPQGAEGPATVGIVLFPGVEVLDFAGPFEVFSVASRIAPQTGADGPPFAVVTVAARVDPVVARHGLRVLPDAAFADAPPIDVLIVPGGIVDAPLADEETLAWIGAAASRAAITASVCTGAFILGRIGLLEGCRATTHWEDIAELREAFRRTDVVEGVPYVDWGRIVTSAGISAGIAMSLHLVDRLAGRDLAILTARQMQYDWRPDQRPTSRVPSPASSPPQEVDRSRPGTPACVSETKSPPPRR